MKTRLKYSIIMTIMFAVLMIIPVSGATGTEGAALWELSSVSLGHNKVSFTVSKVTSAQDATAVVYDSEGESILYQLPLSITNATQSFSIDITEGYLIAGNYKVSVKDTAGNESDMSTGRVENHAQWDFYPSDSNAYPNTYLGQIRDYDELTAKGIFCKAKVEVAFTEYDGTVDEEGNIRIEYPKQNVGTVIKVILYDDFGCTRSIEETIEDRRFPTSSFIAYHNGIIFKYVEIAPDIRLCAEVDGKKYYSEYGLKYSDNEDFYIEYPDTSSSTIKAWYESSYGSVSDKKEYELNSCELKDCGYDNYKCTRTKAYGTIEPSKLGFLPTTVSITMDEKEYTCDVAADRSFSLSYPIQSTGASVKMVFSDDHGCSYTVTKYASAGLGRLSYLYASHRKISFTFGDCNKTGNMKLVVIDKETKEAIITVPFSVTTTEIMNYEIEFKDDYLAPGTYVAYVVDEEDDGNLTDDENVTFMDHERTIELFNGNAYPTIFTGKIYYYEQAVKEGLVLSVKAKIGDKEYKADIKEDGSLAINYPKQDIDAEVIVTSTDQYGCVSERTYKVEDKQLTFPALKAYRDCITINSAIGLEADERIFVSVNGTSYYSEYGTKGSAAYWVKVLSYPDLVGETVDVTLESTYGSSITKSFEIKGCELSSCKYTIKAYRSQAVGSVVADEAGHIPSKVSVTIGGGTYSADIDANGSFKINYAPQKNDAYLTLHFTDRHGCSNDITERVTNILESRVGYDYMHVLPKKTDVSGLDEGIRIAAIVDGKTYYSGYSNKNGVVTVTYPFQNSGTNITLWFEKADTSKSADMVKKVFEGNYISTINARTNRSSGYIGIDDGGEYSGYNAKLKSAYVIVAGQRYDCTIEEKKREDYDEDYDDEDEYSEEEEYFFDSMYEDTFYTWSVSYPVQKIGTTITLYYTDENEITKSDIVTFENIPPYLKIDKVSSSAKKVTGSTAPNSLATIKVGKKKYTCKANKKGVFSKKIKRVKAGTKITVSVVSPEGYTNNKSIKVKQASGSLAVTNPALATNDTVTIKVSGGNKGDVLSVKVGGKTYKKNLKSNKKNQSITFNIGRRVAGTSIDITLKDKFKKKKDNEKSMVYSGTSITVGMSERDVQLTTWGPPIRKNDWGTGMLQWIFTKGGTTVYVYISNGVVHSVQRINY